MMILFYTRKVYTKGYTKFYSTFIYNIQNTIHTTNFNQIKLKEFDQNSLSYRFFKPKDRGVIKLPNKWKKNRFSYESVVCKLKRQK